jgi:hypothetical protein
MTSSHSPDVFHHPQLEKQQNISQYRHGNLTIIHAKEYWSIWKWFTPLCVESAQSKVAFSIKNRPDMGDLNEKRCKTTPKKSRYVFLFDDGEIFDTNINEIPDLKFKFFYGTYIPFPVWFEKKVDSRKPDHNRCFFYKNQIQPEIGNDFKHLFQSYSNYNPAKIIQSDCNMIYHCYKVGTQPEIFGLIRIKSKEDMPQFQFAYDHEEFTKDEIVYFIHHIFETLKKR